jgi:Mn2+/Fe2+ NRAMP family transporter
MWGMARDQHGDRDAVRITTASASRTEEIAGRQRRYVISMGIRTVCFVAAILVGAGWLRWVLVAAALLLPYVAVVMANAVHSKNDDFTLRPGAGTNRELPAGE